MALREAWDQSLRRKFSIALNFLTQFPGGIYAVHVNPPLFDTAGNPMESHRLCLMGSFHGSALQQGEGFVVGALLHEVAQPWGHDGTECVVQGGNAFRHLFQLLQMRGRIAVAQRMIGNDGEAGAEECGE